MSNTIHGWSPLDCRNYSPYPNAGVTQLGGAVFYCTFASNNNAVPGEDCRVSVPENCYIDYPINSRASEV